jgi:tetratricopeptide (TPR) repeat protein
VPPAIYFAAAMTSGLDIGYRHVLPIVGFLCVLIAGGAASLVHRNRRWIWVLCALLFAHIAFSLRSYPDFMAYSSAFPSGKMQTYRYLTDSNVDWGQGLIETREWLRAHGIRDCYIAYDGAADLDYYGIPCRRLSGNATDAEAVPPAMTSGVFVIGALSYSGIEWEPGDLNPYAAFRNAKPEANIGGSMLVYRGTFDLRALQAATYRARAYQDLTKAPQKALEEATAAVELAPRNVRAHLARAQALAATGDPAQAGLEFERALKLAEETGNAWYPNQIAEAQRGLDALKDK